MPPQTSSNTPSAITMKRLFSASSTAFRINQPSSPLPNPTRRAVILSRLKDAEGTQRFEISIHPRSVEILASSLLHCVLQHQRVRNHLLASLNPGNNLLQISRQLRTRGNLDAPELLISRRDVNPIAIMQMQNRRR